MEKEEMVTGVVGAMVEVDTISIIKAKVMGEEGEVTDRRCTEEGEDMVVEEVTEIGDITTEVGEMGVTITERDGEVVGVATELETKGTGEKDLKE